MTENTTSSDKLTPEQIDFLQNSMLLGSINLKAYVDENGVTYFELLERVTRATPYRKYMQDPDSMMLEYGWMFVANDYPSMSDKEQVNFLYSQLQRIDNPVVKHYASRIKVDECNNVADLQEKFNELWRQKIGFKYLDNLKYTPSRPSKAEMETQANQGEFIFSTMCLSAQRFANYPPTPEPEPEVELEAPAPAQKPRGMATKSKDPRKRIDEWMEYLGKADQAQALVDKYGLEVAHKICQQSMLAPADLKDVTGGTSLSSKNAVQYFLDNEVSPDKLATIPGLDAEKVEASLKSVAPVEEEVVVEDPVQPVAPGEKPVEELVEAMTPILEEAGILDVLDNVELNPDGSLNRDSLHTELASMMPSEEAIDPASYFSNDKLRRRMERRAERKGQTLGEYLDDRAERKGVSAEEFVADKEEKIKKREAKREAFVADMKNLWGL